MIIPLMDDINLYGQFTNHEVWKIARKVNAIDICMPPEVINCSACNISLEIGEVICCSQDRETPKMNKAAKNKAASMKLANSLPR